MDKRHWISWGHYIELGSNTIVEIGYINEIEPRFEYGPKFEPDGIILTNRIDHVASNGEKYHMDEFYFIDAESEPIWQLRIPLRAGGPRPCYDKYSIVTDQSIRDEIITIVNSLL